MFVYVYILKEKKKLLKKKKTTPKVKAERRSSANNCFCIFEIQTTNNIPIETGALKHFEKVHSKIPVLKSLFDKVPTL